MTSATVHIPRALRLTDASCPHSVFVALHSISRAAVGSEIPNVLLKNCVPQRAAASVRAQDYQQRSEQPAVLLDFTSVTSAVIVHCYLKCRSF
jgi:hypothetical protein